MTSWRLVIWAWSPKTYTCMCTLWNKCCECIKASIGVDFILGSLKMQSVKLFIAYFDFKIISHSNFLLIKTISMGCYMIHPWVYILGKMDRFIMKLILSWNSSSVLIFFTPMALAHPLHPIKSRSRNKCRNLWVGWCVSPWRPWYWPMHPIYYIYIYIYIPHIIAAFLLTKRYSF